MSKQLVRVVLVMLLSITTVFAQSAKDVTGLWFMYDLNAKEPSGVIQVYEYQGKIYGRTLVSFEKDGTVRKYTDSDLEGAKHIQGNPATLGLDVIWGLEWNEKKERFEDGYILDPRKKNPYNVQLHRDGDILKMRGSLGPFGATIDWKRATEADLHGVKPFVNPVPVIYYNDKGKLIKE